MRLGDYMKSSSPRCLNLQNWGGRTRTSNFQSRAGHALRVAPKQDKNLSDPSNVEETPAKPKIDPETVTKPSPPATPAEDL